MALRPSGCGAGGPAGAEELPLAEAGRTNHGRGNPQPHVRQSHAGQNGQYPQHGNRHVQRF